MPLIVRSLSIVSALDVTLNWGLLLTQWLVTSEVYAGSTNTSHFLEIKIVSSACAYNFDFWQILRKHIEADQHNVTNTDDHMTHVMWPSVWTMLISPAVCHFQLYIDEHYLDPLFG